MQSYRTRIVTVDAVQWTGANLEAVQKLLWPRSPLTSGEEGKVNNLGVYVDKAAPTKYDTRHELAFADVNDWVVKYPSGRVAIVKQPHFEEYFEAVDPSRLAALGDDDPSMTLDRIPPAAPTIPLTDEERDGLRLGTAIAEIGDRQPALDGDRVSER